jgi:hypothetical protein
VASLTLARDDFTLVDQQMLLNQCLNPAMNLQIFAVILAAACVCIAVFAASRAFHVSQDRQMERFYERSVESARFSAVEVDKRKDETLATLRSRQTLPKSLPMPEYLQRVKDAPMFRNLELAVLKQAEEEIQMLRQQQQDSSARFEQYQRRREENTFFWTVVSLGLAAVAGICCLISVSLRTPPILALRR